MGQIESMRKEMDQHDRHHLLMTKELQELRVERDDAKAALAKDMDAIRAQQQRQENVLQTALRSLAEETEAFQKHTTTAGTASASATVSVTAASTTANAFSGPVAPLFHNEHSSSSAPVIIYPDGVPPPFFGSASIPVPGNQFKYDHFEQQQRQQQPQYQSQHPSRAHEIPIIYPGDSSSFSQYQEQQPVSQQYYEQQHPQYGVEESKGIIHHITPPFLLSTPYHNTTPLWHTPAHMTFPITRTITGLEDHGGEDRGWSRRTVPSSSVHGSNTAGGGYVMGDYPTSASDGDDSEDFRASDPMGMGMGVELGQGRHTHPRGRHRRSHEVGVGYEELRNENDRKDGVNSVRTVSRERDDPVRDVLSKFLDIYQDDQEKMKKKLEELAVEPPLSSSSSGVRFTDQNQAPPAPSSSSSSANASKSGKKQSKASSSSSNSSPPRPPWRSNRSPERAGDRGDNNRKGVYPGDLLETKNEREHEKIRRVASSGYAHGAVGVGVNHELLREEEEELVGSLFHTRGTWMQHNRSISPHHRSNNSNDLGSRRNTNTGEPTIPEPLFPFAPTSAPSTSTGFVSGLGRTLSSKKLSRSGGVTKK